VGAASIGVLRLREPVEWGSLDGAPVRMVVLLAMRESDAATRHMQVFARLARKMMSEAFREELISADGADDVVTLLRRHLETV
jgi:PTS system fructose-specific IIA component